MRTTAPRYEEKVKLSSRRSERRWLSQAATTLSMVLFASGCAAAATSGAPAVPSANTRVHVGDADEAGRCMGVTRSVGSIFMDTAAAVARRPLAFTGYQTFRPFLRWPTEGDAGWPPGPKWFSAASRMLKLASAQRYHIVAFQFGDQLVGKGRRFLLTQVSGASLGRRAPTSSPLQNRDRIGGQVTHGDLIARVFSCHCSNKK